MSEPFHLERFFAAHEFTTPHLLAVSDCETRTVGELLDLEGGARERFEALALGYTESAGHPELRAAVAAHHPGLDPVDVVVHAAGVEVLHTVARALVAPGDAVVVQVPCYQALRSAPESAGGRVIPWQARWRETRDGAGRWEWHEDEYAALLSRGDVRLVVLNSPHNPTGRRFDEATLRRLLARAGDAGARVLVDEAYAGTELEGDGPPSAAELDPRALALGLVSKALGLPGLRIGWLLCRDPAVRRAVERAKDHTTICAPAPAEFLATVALRHRDALLRGTRGLLRANRLRLADFVAAHRDWFLAAPPEASSVCFPRVAPGAPMGAAELCERARVEAGVLLAPGGLFGATAPRTVPSPVADGVRVGFGRASFPGALQALEGWLAQAAP